MLKSGTFISDRYEILERVGSGGMADVYKAKCHKLNRFVAIKVLKQDYSEDKSFVAKFKNEAQSAAGLSHPNIVNVYDVGEDNGLYYIVMELIEGITLKQYIERKGRLTIKESVSIAIQVAQGIEAAHNNHIIHRDIKPQNIIISKEGKVKVTDFGIARATTANTNTINSNAVGSVHYISPEQARGGYIDEKSDIYSLGITLFEMLAGRVPFEGDSTVTIALQHIQNDIPNLKALVPDIPISVEKIVYKCTQKKADRRYLKINSLIADLKRSLVTPDEDFVVLSTVGNDGTTIVISDDEISTIKKASALTDDDIDTIQSGDTNDELSKTQILENENDDIDAVNPKFDKIIAVGSIAVGIIILIFLIVLVSKIMKNFGINTSMNNSVTVKTEETLDDMHTYVPNVIGLTENEAMEKLNENGLGVAYEYDFDETIEKGLVCKQSELADTVVEKHIQVVITLSKGPEVHDMIDVVGQDLTTAMQKLEALELNVTVEYDFSPSEVNKVIAQSKSTRVDVRKGDEVTITCSRGPEYKATTTVPSLVGAKQKDVSGKLSGAGLKLGKVIEVYSDTVKKDRVIAQLAKSGSQQPLGSSVDIVVSLGKKEIPTETETQEQTETQQESQSDQNWGEQPSDQNWGEQPSDQNWGEQTTPPNQGEQPSDPNQQDQQNQQNQQNQGWPQGNWPQQGNWPH